MLRNGQGIRNWSPCIPPSIRAATNFRVQSGKQRLPLLEKKKKKAQMRHRTNIKQNSVSKRVFRLPVNNITIITHLPYPLPEFGRLDTPVVPPSAAYPKSLGHGLLRMMINDPYIMWRRDSCFSASQQSAQVFSWRPAIRMYHPLEPVQHPLRNEPVQVLLFRRNLTHLTCQRFGGVVILAGLHIGAIVLANKTGALWKLRLHSSWWPVIT